MLSELQSVGGAGGKSGKSAMNSSFYLIYFFTRCGGHAAMMDGVCALEDGLRSRTCCV